MSARGCTLQGAELRSQLPCYGCMCQPDKGLGKQKQGYAKSLGSCKKGSLSYKLSDQPLVRNVEVSANSKSS